MGKLSFEMSGHGDYPFTLNDVQQLALELGYAKPDVMTNKPLGARVDLKSFFDQYHVKAFSTFKKKFCSEVLKPIGPGGTPMAVKKVRARALVGIRCCSARVHTMTLIIASSVCPLIIC